MGIDYKEIADRAVAYAGQSNIVLDFSMDSIGKVDLILDKYYENRAEYEGKDGADTLWNIAVHFGIYLGEAMLRLGLREKGYEWYVDGGMPVLKGKGNTQISPLTKAHKRILNGPGDSVKSFCDVAFMIADGRFPAKKVQRAVDVQLASGARRNNVLYRDIEPYIMRIEEGEEDFLILNSHDGFLQFYGVDDQFVAEVRINLPGGDFRTFSLIDREKERLTERTVLVTPYGRYTPTKREVVSLSQIKRAVQKYYENVNTEEFVKEISCVETTEEMKRCMGLIK